MEVIKQKRTTENGRQPNAMFRFAYLYRDNILLLFVIVLAAAAIGCGFYYYKNNVAAPYEYLTGLEKAIADEQTQLDVYKSVKVDLSQMGESVKKVYSALPYEADLPDLYLQIVEIVKKNGLKLLSFNTANSQGDKEKDKIRTIEMSLNISGGDYFSLKKFLADVSTSLRLMDVKALIYSPTTQNYAVVLNAYYLAED